MIEAFCLAEDGLGIFFWGVVAKGADEGGVCQEVRLYLDEVF